MNWAGGKQPGRKSRGPGTVRRGATESGPAPGWTPGGSAARPTRNRSPTPVLRTVEDGMAKKRSPRVSPALKAVTDERARRLARLLQLLGAGPQTRAALTRHLRLDVRGFYRDLELLRAAGIAVTLENRRYVL